MHLYWEIGNEPLKELSATVEILDEPQVNRIYFWALQASFYKDLTRKGGAHFGLQHNPRHNDNKAVNWGGYNNSGKVLSGTVSDLPSTPNDVNTRDYTWHPNTRYRYRIYQSDISHLWRGEITNLTTGEKTIVRDLEIDATHMTQPMVWTECFADCNASSAAVAWSGFEATTLSGGIIKPSLAKANYQTHAKGGCANTNSFSEVNGIIQKTNTTRTTKQGSMLRLGSASSKL